MADTATVRATFAFLAESPPSPPTYKRGAIANMASFQLTGQDALDESLDRISKKSGVKATLVLDRTTGSLLKASGQISSLRAAPPPQSPSTVSFPTEQAAG